MPKLTPEEITAVYDEIGKMHVELSPDTNKGLQYVKERLTLCRAMQDRLAELTLRVNRALSDVMTEALALKMKNALAPDTPTQQRMQVVEGERQDHLLLTKMLRMQAQLLSRTSMDVRLLADLTKEQLKLGEIDPKDAPGLVQETNLADLSPTPASGAGGGGTPLSGTNGTSVIPVTFADPSATMEASEESSIDFDDLFGALTNGQAASRIS